MSTKWYLLCLLIALLKHESCHGGILTQTFPYSEIRPAEFCHQPDNAQLEKIPRDSRFLQHRRSETLYADLRKEENLGKVATHVDLIVLPKTRYLDVMCMSVCSGRRQTSGPDLLRGRWANLSSSLMRRYKAGERRTSRLCPYMSQ